MEGIGDPEGRDDADVSPRIEPQGRDRDVERPPHLALRFGLRDRVAREDQEREDQDQCPGDDSSRMHASSLAAGRATFFYPFEGGKARLRARRRLGWTSVRSNDRIARARTPDVRTLCGEPIFAARA